MSSSWTYFGFFVLSAVSGALLLPFGHRADSAGRRPVLILGLLVGAAGLASLPLVPNAAGLIFAMALLGVSGAALSVASGAILGDVVGGRGGTVVATYQMAGDAGIVAGPVVAGWLADSHGYGATFGVAAAILVVPVGAVLLAPETRQAGPAPALDEQGTKLGRAS